MTVATSNPTKYVRTPADLSPTAQRSPLATDAPVVSTQLLDWVERSIVLALYGWLVLRLLVGSWSNGQVANLLLLPSEGLVVVFLLLRRRPTAISQHPGEWLMAIAATCAPMLVGPGGQATWLPP